MMPIGSPKETDGVARVERAVNSAMERAGLVFKNVQGQFPRAVGSEAVSSDDEFAEFVGGVADNPQAVAEMLTGWRKQYGDAESLSMLADFIERNEKRLGRLG